LSTMRKRNGAKNGSLERKPILGMLKFSALQIHHNP
jgi:hypothetical protein